MELDKFYHNTDVGSITLPINCHLPSPRNKMRVKNLEYSTSQACTMAAIQKKMDKYSVSSREIMSFPGRHVRPLTKPHQYVPS
jgi:hypothetical protein